MVPAVDTLRSIRSYLACVKSMPNANVTIDPYAAYYVAGQTRFSMLNIGNDSGIHGGCQLSWARTGTRVPPIPGPEQLFKMLFDGIDEKDKLAAADRFRLQGSTLDLVRGDAAHYQRSNQGKIIAAESFSRA